MNNIQSRWGWAIQIERVCNDVPPRPKFIVIIFIGKKS